MSQCSSWPGSGRPFQSLSVGRVFDAALQVWLFGNAILEGYGKERVHSVLCLSFDFGRQPHRRSPAFLQGIRC